MEVDRNTYVIVATIATALPQSELVATLQSAYTVGGAAGFFDTRAVAGGFEVEFRREVSEDVEYIAERVAAGGGTLSDAAAVERAAIEQLAAEIRETAELAGPTKARHGGNVNLERTQACAGVADQVLATAKASDAEALAAECRDQWPQVEALIENGESAAA